jgi:hypothetical protein
MLFNEHNRYLDRLQAIMRERSSSLRLGNVVMAVAIRSLIDFRLASAKEAATLCAAFDAKSAAIWPEYAPT